jgi:hypothetical protein
VKRDRKEEDEESRREARRKIEETESREIKRKFVRVERSIEISKVRRRRADFHDFSFP